ncbi:MAG: hypothetical protein QGF92_08955, partial [Gammaproteobacteria bacterium]|nr:hypothetical protein [Gammaproteobacteria bacterium]
WGNDYYVQVSNIPSGTGFTAITAGGAFHSLALAADGSITSWGQDNEGVVSNTPDGTGFTTIAGGAFHSLALKADGSPPSLQVTQ